MNLMGLIQILITQKQVYIKSEYSVDLNLITILNCQNVFCKWKVKEWHTIPF